MAFNKPLQRPYPSYQESHESSPMLPIRIPQEDEKFNPKRVFLLTGASKFRGKFDYFMSLIPYTDEWRLMNGDVFVYCNQQRTQISALQWQGDGFALFFKRTGYGRYPWPTVVERKLIEITPMDLQMLLETPRFMQRVHGLGEAAD